MLQLYFVSISKIIIITVAVVNDDMFIFTL